MVFLLMQKKEWCTHQNEIRLAHTDTKSDAEKDKPFPFETFDKRNANKVALNLVTP